MVEFTPEVIEVVKTRFSSFDIEMSEVKDRLTTIYDQPFMTQFSDETDRQMAAVKILMAQVIAQTDKKSFSKAETFLMRIEGKDEVVAFRRQDGTESYRSNLYVTVIDNGEAKFGQVTLWGDANDMHPSLTIQKVYELPGVINSRDPISIGINDVVYVEIIKNKTIPEFADVIKNDFNPINVNEMEFNISDDWKDLKLVKGTVVTSWMKLTKNDKNMGFLKLVGDDPEEITVVKFGRSADQVVMYGAGSMVYVLGQVTNAVLDNSGVEQYPVSMWGSLIVPMVVIPPEMNETPGIETAETSIQKADGTEGGFTEESIEGW